MFRFLPGLRNLPSSLKRLGILSAFTLSTSPAAEVPHADIWHLTARVFIAQAIPPSFEEELITGTATLLPKAGSETLYTLTFDIEDEIDTIELALEGDRLVGESVEDLGDGHSEHWKMVIRIVDNDTLMMSDFYTVTTTDDFRPSSYDSAGGVLTRNPIPEPQPAAWEGIYTRRAVQDYGVNDGLEGIETEEEDFGEISLELLEAGTYQLLGADGEDIIFNESDGVLLFTESDTFPDLIWEDENWRMNRVLFEDRAYLFQIGGGRIFLLGSGAEIVKLQSQTTDEEEVYMDWADMFMGLFGPAIATPEEDFSTWAARLGLEGEAAQPTARPYPDGLPNLVRYAMNLGASPAAGDLPVSGMRVIEGKLCLTLEFRMRKEMAGVSLVAQQSATLNGGWADLAEGSIQQLPDADPATLRCRATLPFTPGGARFLRLHAVAAD